MAEFAKTLPIPGADQHVIPDDGPYLQNSLEITHVPGDRDSDVFFLNHEGLPHSSRPTLLSSPAHSSSQHPMTPQRSDSTARRLRRPAELNLGTNASLDPSKPRSELELRYDLIRNSQSQRKATLRSPTQLLQDRLNFSPKKSEKEDKVRIFTPPRPMLNGCILPGPAAQLGAFSGSSVRARIDKGDRPAWWCKVDKLVVFDGVEQDHNGEMKFKTRSSKGLTIARRRGDTETVIIPMECFHCQKMLNRTEWKYDIQVCKRGVCWDCRERCRWEMDEERKEAASTIAGTAKTNVSRMRADSVLQGDNLYEQELMAKVGIDQRPQTPIETVGGIEERLEDATRDSNM